MSSKHISFALQIIITLSINVIATKYGTGLNTLISDPNGQYDSAHLSITIDSITNEVELLIVRELGSDSAAPILSNVTQSWLGIGFSEVESYTSGHPGVYSIIVDANSDFGNVNNVEEYTLSGYSRGSVYTVPEITVTSDIYTEYGRNVTITRSRTGTFSFPSLPDQPDTNNEYQMHIIAGFGLGGDYSAYGHGRESYSRAQNILTFAPLPSTTTITNLPTTTTTTTTTKAANNPSTTVDLPDTTTNLPENTKNIPSTSSTTPSPPVSNDFCNRSNYLNINTDATICNIIDLHNLPNSFLVKSDGTISDVKSITLWKDEQLFLLIVYLVEFATDTPNIIYADIFDNDGNNIVSNHIIVGSGSKEGNNELQDVSIMSASLETGYREDYEDITTFVVLHGYENAKVIKYSVCEFTGDSIINNIQDKKLVSRSDNLFLYSYSATYLFISDAYILFGLYSDMSVSVLIFDSDGTSEHANILNENEELFNIDYDSNGIEQGDGQIPTISCGFNGIYDICFLNWVVNGYSKGKIISIILSTEGDTAHITTVKDEFFIDFNTNYQKDYAVTPVIIPPDYDKFFVPNAGLTNQLMESAAIYDLDGNILVDEFQFHHWEGGSVQYANCYSTYHSDIIVCHEQGQDALTYIFDLHGNALPYLAAKNILLTETKLNDYMKVQHRNDYEYFGDFALFSSKKQLIPITSNDFWVVFKAKVSNMVNTIVFAVKLSIYDECCDIYLKGDSGNNIPSTTKNAISSTGIAIPSSTETAIPSSMKNEIPSPTGIAIPSLTETAISFSTQTAVSSSTETAENNIPSSTAIPSPTKNARNERSGKLGLSDARKTLSGAEITGICIGVVFAVFIIVVAFVRWYVKKKSGIKAIEKKEIKYENIADDDNGQNEKICGEDNTENLELKTQ